MDIISISDREKLFPDRLRHLAQPPKQLYCVGTVGLEELLERPVVSIVGSRKVTNYGRQVSSEISFELAKQGIVVVSGLALGVDSIVHAAALEAKGTTIAVLPSGIENIYPRSHHGLARRIVTSNGLIVSEYEGKQSPRQYQFIERNRIIAGLADALLVTEAAEKSGSLHTARFALEQGKTVLAVPGNITSPNSTGTNNLIKSGAIPVTSYQDVLDAIGFQQVKGKKPVYLPENEKEETILKAMASGIENGEEILIKSGLDVVEFQQHLTMLEIKGVISPLGNNQWQLK